MKRILNRSISFVTYKDMIFISRLFFYISKKKTSFCAVKEEWISKVEWTVNCILKICRFILIKRYFIKMYPFMFLKRQLFLYNFHSFYMYTIPWIFQGGKLVLLRPRSKANNFRSAYYINGHSVYEIPYKKMIIYKN